MRRQRRIITWMTVLCLMGASALSAGCSAENISINYLLPLGLGGSPGFYNPFGIVQAFVNSWLGTVLPGSSSTTGSTTTGTGGSPSPTPTNVGAIGATVTQPGS